MTITLDMTSADLSTSPRWITCWTLSDPCSSCRASTARTGACCRTMSTTFGARFFSWCVESRQDGSSDRSSNGVFLSFGKSGYLPTVVGTVDPQADEVAWREFLSLPFWCIRRHQFQGPDDQKDFQVPSCPHVLARLSRRLSPDTWRKRDNSIATLPRRDDQADPPWHQANCNGVRLQGSPEERHEPLYLLPPQDGITKLAGTFSAPLYLVLGNI